MKKIMFTLLLVAGLLFSLVSCNNNSDVEVDYGTLSISDVTFTSDSSAEINPIFSINECKENINYSYSENRITINDNIVTSNDKDINEQFVVTVTAKTSHHETTFKVTVNPIDYGTLTIQDISFEWDQEATITKEFSNSLKAEDITYSYIGNDITINGDLITALETETKKEVTVTASSTHFNTTFKVTVNPIDYGTLKINNKETISSTIGNKTPLVAYFSKTNRAEEVTYELKSDETVIKLIEEDGNTYLVPLKANEETSIRAYSTHFDINVTIKTKPATLTYSENAVTVIYAAYGAFDISHFNYPSNVSEELCDKNFTYEIITPVDGVTLNQNGTLTCNESAVGSEIRVKVTSSTGVGEQTFTVKNYVHTFYNNDNDNLHSRSGNLNEYIDGVSSGVDALFVGDSFFNPGNKYGGYSTGWWYNFYDEWKGTKAYTVGISGAYVEDWEAMLFSTIIHHNPKNVVLHIGVNDINVLKTSADGLIPQLKSLVNHIHEYLPEAHIYWFTCEPNGSGLTEATIPTNEALMAYAEANDWFTVIDSYSWCFNSQGKVDLTFFKEDYLHPADASYKYYIQGLIDAGMGLIPTGWVNLK